MKRTFGRTCRAACGEHREKREEDAPKETRIARDHDTADEPGYWILVDAGCPVCAHWHPVCVIHRRPARSQQTLRHNEEAYTIYTSKAQSICSRRSLSAPLVPLAAESRRSLGRWLVDSSSAIVVF